MLAYWHQWFITDIVLLCKNKVTNFLWQSFIFILKDFLNILGLMFNAMHTVYKCPQVYFIDQVLSNNS